MLVPPGVEHGLRMIGDGISRWLAIWPKALDGFPEAAERAAADDAGPEVLADLRRQHGILPGRQR